MDATEGAVRDVPLPGGGRVEKIRRMNRRRCLGVLFVTAVLSTSCGVVSSAAPLPCLGGSERSVARMWNERILDAIRRDTPAPTVHARNLYHLSAAMWDGWAAYDEGATGLFVDETLAFDENSRATTISYAAYTVLTARYRNAVGGFESIADFDAELTGQCLDIPGADGARLSDAARFGIEIGTTILDASLPDGSLEQDRYVDLSYEAVNPALVVADPGVGQLVDPDRWQPLQLKQSISQNGQQQVSALQSFIGPQWGLVMPFALEQSAIGLPIDPGPPPLFASDPASFAEAAVEVIEYQATLGTDESPVADRSPTTRGNNSLGFNDGTGYDRNPVSGDVYNSNPVTDADFGRVVAEFWADGPSSETPPGHWNSLANFVSDHPSQEYQFRGEGEPLERLEWDIKLYLAMNGAVHDAAIAAWGSKRYFDSSRPITIIRYLGGLGQSSEPDAASYHPDGLPLRPGLIELVTAESAVDRHVGLTPGAIAIRGWAGHEDLHENLDEIAWIDATTWVPYQLDTFVTPSFPGFVSGHSAFSRAGAEVLTAFTGSEFFPGGLGEWEAPIGWLHFDEGPSQPVVLQWATYYDAADQAGESRLYGGIHIAADDIEGRRIGAQVGLQAVERAFDLFGARGMEATR